MPPRTQGWVAVYEAMAADFDRALPQLGFLRASITFGDLLGVLKEFGGSFKGAL